MIWVVVSVLLLLLGKSQASANLFNSANDEDYQDDASVDYGQFLQQQQVVLPEHLENPPYMMYPSPNKMKLVDDGKRRRGFKPLNGGLPFGGGIPMRGGPIDVLAGIKLLNVSHKTDTSWPDAGIKFGAVAGVSLDQKGNVVMFHRADRVWTEKTFDLHNVFLEKHLGTIQSNTILGINRKTGQLAYGFGKGLFYMPHGITVDKENNIWVTDVALHQVMKLNREIAGDAPLMVLGTKFVNGNGKLNFCKPTSVAVLPSGDFFVADGYCNARIIKYNKIGERILEWGKNTFGGRAYAVAPVNYFAIPHGLTLALDKGLVCVADRENGRVQCFHHNNGTFHSQYYNPLIGDRLFAVAYAPINGGQLYVVNGPPIIPSVRMEVKGFVIDMASGNVTAKFPDDRNYSNPHDLAVTEDASEIYVVEYEPYRVHKLLAVGRRNGSAATINAGKTSSLKGVLIVAMVVVLGLLVAGSAWVVVRHRKRGGAGVLQTIYRPRGSTNRRRKLAWELFPGKSDLNLGNLLDGNRGTGKRHRKPSTSRGKFKQLGQESEDEEATSMLTRNGLEESCGEELA